MTSNFTKFLSDKATDEYCFDGGMFIFQTYTYCFNAVDVFSQN